MAKSATVSNISGEKKKQDRGPVVRKFHFFGRVVDMNGQPIPGAKFTVVKVLTDAAKVVDFMETDEYKAGDLIRIRHDITSEQRPKDSVTAA